MAESWQAMSDGTLEMGVDPDKPRKEIVQATIENALHSLDWQTNIIQDPVRSNLTIEIEKGDKKLKLEIIDNLKVAWSSGGRDLHEKRIQLGSFANHDWEFRLDKTSAHKCLLLGFYQRNEDMIICAWDAFSYLNHASPTSCYVRVEAIASAMRDGFGQSVDTKNRYVCCFRPDFLAYYINNMHELHGSVVVSDPVTTDPEGDILEAVSPDSGLLPRNRIIYGAPGTGKSYGLNEEALRNFPREEQRKRVTFYPDYSYAQFIGCYRPVPVYRDSSVDIYEADHVTECQNKQEPLIDYRFVPGPFLELLCEAKKNTDKKYVLIIEELNRADAPAVFGEAFQMLDREESGEGAFPVNLSREAIDYLRSKGCPDAESLRLPKNLYLWATMNSADQGVMPLDAAFKRRWSFEYLPLNKHESATDSWTLNLEFNKPNSILWNNFRKAINDQLQLNNISEDRLIGPFFMKESELSNKDAFKNKLLLYLCDDIARHNHGILFNKGNFGQVSADYDAGSDIFIEGIHKKLNELPVEENLNEDAEVTQEVPNIAEENSAT